MVIHDIFKPTNLYSRTNWNIHSCNFCYRVLLFMMYRFFNGALWEFLVCSSYSIYCINYSVCILLEKFPLAHFNPAVTIGYYITGHITKIQDSYGILQLNLLVQYLGSLVCNVKFYWRKMQILEQMHQIYDYSIFLIFPC